MNANQTIQIIETTPKGKEYDYECRGLLEAICAFGTGVRDDDHEAFTEAGFELQEEQNLTAEKIQKCFQRFTENIIHVGFVNE